MYDFITHYTKREQMSVKYNIMINNDPHADLCPMTLADMEFMSAPEIQQQLIHHITTQPLGYTEASDRYYEVLTQWYKDHHQLTINPKHIYLEHGVITGLLNAIHAFTEPGDSIGVLTPAYPQFFKIINASARVLVESSLINTMGVYTIDFDHLESIFKQPKTTAFILCNPHNPVGRVWTHDELSRINTLAIQYNVLILSDEIHCDLTFDNHKHIVLQSINKDSIVFSSASKAFNLAALQCAHVIINNEIQQKAWEKHMKTTGSHGPNALGIVASQAAYEYGAQWLHEVRSVIKENETTLRLALKNTQVILSPLEGTYLMWMDLNPYLDKHPLLLKKLREAHLHFHLGTSFGVQGKGFVRINIACPHDIIVEVSNRLVKIINELE